VSETILVFIAANGERMTKIITQTPDGAWAKEQAQQAMWFRVAENHYEGLEGFQEVLEQLLPHPTAFIVRGGLCRPIEEGEAITRRHSENYLDDDKALLVEAERCLVPVDLDDVPLGEDYNEDDIGGMIEKAIESYLPEMFHDADVVWELSSGALLKGDGTLNCHLFFMSDRPVGTVWLREFMKTFAPDTDDSIYKFGQPLYTAAPIVTNGDDPVPTRLGIIRKSEECVTLPDMTVDAIEEHAVSNGVGLLSHAKGFEAKLALMGHGEGLSGFHAVTRDAPAAYVSGLLPDEVDVDAVVDRMYDVVQAAPKNRDAPYYRIYSDKNYLKNQVTSAMKKFCRKPCKPFHHAAEQEVESVRHELVEGLRTALLGQVGSIEPPLVTLLQVGTGIGKTHAALSLLPELKAEADRMYKDLSNQIKEAVDEDSRDDLKDLRRLAGRMRRMVYAVPTHSLAEEVVRRVEGVSAVVWRGRTQLDPDSYDDALMCLRARLIDEMVDHGIAVSSMCESKVNGKDPIYCPHYGDCGYQAQVAPARKADVVVVPHASLVHEMPPINSRGVLIVDETFWATTLSGPLEVKVSLLREWGKTDSVWQEIYDGVVDAPDGAVSMANMPGAVGLEWLLQRLAKPERPPFKPDWAGKKIRAAVKAFGVGNDWRRKHRLVINLRRSRAKGHDVCVRVRKHGDLLKLTWRSPIRRGWSGQTTLLMDASLDPELAQIALEGSHIDFDVNLRPKLFAQSPHVTTMQVVDQPFGIRRFIDEDDNPLEAVDEVLAFIRLVSLSGKTLVIGQQKVELELLARGVPDQVEVTHLNAIRGIDKWKDARNVIVIGRTAATPMDIESMAEHFTGEPVSTSLCDDRKFNWFMQRDKGIRMGDGSGYAVQADYHPDPICERIRNQIAEEEVDQALERGRGVNRTADNPINYFLLTNTVTRQVVQHPVKWEDIRPGKFERMMGGGLVFFNQADMVAAYPEMWKNTDAVKCWKKGQKGRKGVIPYYITYLIGNHPFHEKTDCADVTEPGLAEMGFIQGKYQRSKPHAKRCRFWFHPDLCQKPEKRLIEILGPLRLFDLVVAEKLAVAA
jgi:hypothetical protein